MIKNKPHSSYTIVSLFADDHQVSLRANAASWMILWCSSSLQMYSRRCGSLAITKNFQFEIVTVVEILDGAISKSPARSERFFMFAKNALLWNRPLFAIIWIIRTASKSPDDEGAPPYYEIVSLFSIAPLYIHFDVCPSSKPLLCNQTAHYLQIF